MKKLDFREQRQIEMLKKFNDYIPRHSSVTLYKSFARPRLDYTDIIYEKPNNASMSKVFNIMLP